MTNPMNQWMDPEQWMGQFSETASSTIDMATQNMKTWNDQVKQTLDETTKTINSAMETIRKLNDEACHTWETSMNNLKDTYKTPTSELIMTPKKS